MTVNEVEGIIKYKTKSFTQESKHSNLEIVELESWREILYSLHLIGQYDDGIGFGNISRRYQSKESFLITASQNGHLPYLGKNDYTLVESYDLDTFEIDMAGVNKASSEALTHAAIYSANPKINFVFHAHHLKMWNYLIETNSPGIDKNITYGTKEMADAVSELCKERPYGVVVMKGHHEGVIAYGETALEAGLSLLNVFNKLD